MKEEILKIVRENGKTDIETIKNIDMATLYEITVDMVAIVSELMLCDLDDIKYHKFAKSMKETMCMAIDEGYTNANK